MTKRVAISAPQFLRRRYGDAAGTSNLTNVRLTRQKSALFQWLAVPLWFPPGKDSVPADSGDIPFTILRSRKRVTRRHRLGLQTALEQQDARI
jgi:hypothetical protein